MSSIPDTAALAQAGDGEPAIDEQQPVEEDDDAHEREESAGNDLDGAQMWRQTLQGGTETVEGEAKREEWHTQTERVHGEKQHAGLEGAGLGGEDQNAAKDGADTWSPADGKDEADEEGERVGAALGAEGEAFFAVETGQAQDAGDVQPKENQHNAADLAKLELMTGEVAAQNAGGGAEGDEGDGEASDE